MRVAVVMPLGGACWHRQTNAEVVARRWCQEHPEWPLAAPQAPPGAPWIKARVVTPAVEATNADIVIVTDADVWCEAKATVAAVRAVADGAPWAIPHAKVLRLTPAASARWRSVPFIHPGPDDLDEVPYTGTASGGLCVYRRSVYLDCPLDPRFVGWGGEDHSAGYALATLHGPPWRGHRPLIHLWHPPAERVDRRVGSAENEALRRRYRMATGHVPSMRALIQEAKAWQH